MKNNPASQPIDTVNRITSIDILRGFALLGILVMNIQSFSMPGAAYLNPTAYGDLAGLNLYTWLVSHIFADQKFMSIFSMLFGAGVCVFAERAAAKTGYSAALHYRRTFWLLLFGLIHAYALWYGDILVAYALCGFWVYLFRNRSAKALLITGMIFASVSSIFYLMTGFSMDHFPADATAQIIQAWSPDQELLNAEIAAYQGSWLQQMPFRSAEAFFLQSFVFLSVFVWRAGGMMLIGMALYKWGILSAGKNARFYWKMLVVNAALGLAIIIIGLTRNFEQNFSMEYSMYIGSQFNYWGSIFMAMAYVALVLLIIQGKVLVSLQHRLSAVGRTAFSNYILQTVICTLIFYGHGLGLFGEVQRYQQILIVIAIWILQLWIAPLWLARYRFGPLEWVWRSLTYWKRQPMKRLDG